MTRATLKPPAAGRQRVPGPRPLFPRPLVITLGVGALALAAVYYARSAPAWDNPTRVLVAAGFLAISSVVVLADWLVRR